MKYLTYGSTGPQVQFLQLALNRAGFGPVATDGSFGFRTTEAVRSFQAEHSIAQTGAAGQRTHHALHPYYTGYLTHTIRRGDTLYAIARQHHTSLRAVEAANPRIHAMNLPIGRPITVPLAFPVVPTGITWSSDVLDCVVEGLTARYPYLTKRTVGRSAMGKPLYALTMGSGRRKVLYNAAHHGNEWITTPVLLKFAEDLAEAFLREQSLQDIPAARILDTAHFVLVPCVNPDGLDVASGFLTEGPAYERVKRIAADYPDIPFPAGWKANIHGVDLNLQYPAAWEQARDIKFAKGYTGPAPRDYVGKAPLTQPEARAMVRLTELVSPDRILAYHTQGGVIYPEFRDFNPPGAMPLAWRMAAASGYDVLPTPPDSATAGYKDWFLQTYNRPGYTIEAGRGVSPLPISDFDEIYRDNLPILVLCATADV